MTEPSFQRGVLLDGAHHGGVESDPGVEAEEPAVDAPEADRPKVTSFDAARQQIGSRNGVVRHAERTSKHIGGTAGQDPQGGVAAGNSGGDLVERSVAAVADDHVDTPPRRVVGEPGGMTASVRFHHLDIVPLPQTSVNDHCVACRDRRRKRVDDQQDSQAADGTQELSRGSDRSVACESMNVTVCVKQIPDPALPGELDPSTNALKRSGKLILDESDSYGVEMALQLVDAAGGGEVGLVSMAPNGEVSGLRTALAMGAAKAVLVSDPELAGSDSLTTAKVLAAAVQKLGQADLIIAGTESSDGYTGTVPEQMAAVLGLPSVTFAKSVVVDGDTLKVNRQTEDGYDEVTCSLPAVVSVTAGVVEPRYPSFKGIMAAKSKPVETVTAADLGVTPVGWVGSNQSITEVVQAPARQAGEVVADDGEGPLKIVAFLENLKVI